MLPSMISGALTVLLCVAAWCPVMDAIDRFMLRVED